MAVIEILKKAPQPQVPKIDYEKELYVTKIADILCDDNSEVRKMIAIRLRDMTINDLINYAKNNSIDLI